MGNVIGLTKRPIKRTLEFLIKGGEASIAFPIGPTLMQHGAKAQDFVNIFNTLTKGLGEFVFPVQIIIYKNGGLDLFIRLPSTSEFFNYFKYEFASDRYFITRTNIYNIAKLKAFQMPFPVLQKTFVNLQYWAVRQGIEIRDE